MDKIIELAREIGIPTSIVLALAILYIITGTIGCIVDTQGKILPEIINWRKWNKRKKEEKNQQIEMLKILAKKLEDFETHCNPASISQRNEWMAWVNSRAAVYDDALDKLLLLQEKLNENNEMTLDLYINVNRNRILDFARIVADDNALISKEEFNRTYKINNEYHTILSKYNRENGEVDTAMKIINEAYDYRLRNRCFIEDVRGYNK